MEAKVSEPIVNHDLENGYEKYADVDCQVKPLSSNPENFLSSNPMSDVEVTTHLGHSTQKGSLESNYTPLSDSMLSESVDASNVSGLLEIQNGVLSLPQASAKANNFLSDDAKNYGHRDSLNGATGTLSMSTTHSSENEDDLKPIFGNTLKSSEFKVHENPITCESIPTTHHFENSHFNKSEVSNDPTILNSYQSEIKTSYPASSADSASNFSSIVETEEHDEVSLLRAKVDDLTTKLMRSQEQLEALLEEKHRWLNSRQQPVPSNKTKPVVSADAAAIVVKFAQSEQQRMKAEARIKELEATIAALKSNQTESIKSGDQSGTIAELNKALTEERERAERLRHSLRQEETRVSDLNAMLTTTREAHRGEQKLAAGQAQVITKLNRDIQSLRRQLKEADKLREREAKRLCNEMAIQETAEKYNKALAEITALQSRITELEVVQVAKFELEIKYHELEKTAEELQGLREEMSVCAERESQLSDFTRRLTERNAALQTELLAASQRLADAERDASEARADATAASDHFRRLEESSRTEREQTSSALAKLEARVAELTKSEETLKADLSRERTEKAALKRKQRALDRELARLTAQQQQRKRSTQPLVSPPPESVGSDRSLTDSTVSLSTIGETAVMISDPSKPAPKPSSDTLPAAAAATPRLGNSLLIASNSNCAEESDGEAMTTAPEVYTLEPNRGMLLNKIDRLQRTNVRLMEKVDFMHEHIAQLTHELQKKTHILQSYFLREVDSPAGTAGAAVPSAVDSNKHQRVRRGGTLMAAVFAGAGGAGDLGGAAPDLRTSLELNQKLQTLLEDILYKNLTLKENVDTLATEVARLKAANMAS